MKNNQQTHQQNKNNWDDQRAYIAMNYRNTITKMYTRDTFNKNDLNDPQTHDNTHSPPTTIIIITTSLGEQSIS